MAARDHYYPRPGNKPHRTVCSYLDKFGEPKHTLYGGKFEPGGCPIPAGSWWPDFGPTVREFSAGGIHHPTEHVFQHEVLPFTAAQKSQSSPDILAKPMRGAVNRATQEAQERPTQFRHPAPATEALWKSTNSMPYKPGGRRKCGEASNWKAALASGAEGMKHGGRMPIWCKGPLLDDPDFHQLHPLKRDEDMPTIHKACASEQVAAGGATGTNPTDTLLLSNKTSKGLGLRDSESIRATMTMNHHRSMSHSATFKNASTRLNGQFESFRTSPMASRNNVNGSLTPSSVTSSASVDSEDQLPNWVASRTIATRDPGAAGGQAGPTSIRKAALTRTK